MDNRALIRAEGFLKDALDAIEIQTSKLKDEPTTPEEMLDDLSRIHDSLMETLASLQKLTDKED